MNQVTQSNITREQWQAIEHELAGSMPHVEFELNGFNIRVSRYLLSESKIELVVLIDGVIEGRWLNENGERPDIIPLVWKQRIKSIYPPSKVKKIEKDLGKRKAKQLFPRLHDKHTWYQPNFSKASMLCRQFKKIKGLTLIKANCLASDSAGADEEMKKAGFKQRSKADKTAFKKGKIYE